jgi:hypothetical protein
MDIKLLLRMFHNKIEILEEEDSEEDIEGEDSEEDIEEVMKEELLMMME